MVDTPNLGMFLPTPTYPMSDVKRCLTDNFKIMEQYAEVPIIAAGAPLPQAGNYEVGDRVFRHDASWPSSYILVVKDADWGWHWRPIQAPLSPWVTLTNNVIHSDFTGIFTIGTVPFAIAMDNRGQVWLRGSIKYTTAGIPAGFYGILKNFPARLKPSSNMVWTVAVNPVTTGVGVGNNAYVGAYFRLNANGASTFRLWNTDTNVLNVWVNGVSYWAAEVFRNGG